MGPGAPEITTRGSSNLRVYQSLSSDPVNKVNMFFGTGTISSSTNSRGNIFPVVSAGPHAYNHWTFTTNGNSPWFFNPHSPKFMGIRCTHQPSVWIGDYAFFDISLPTMKMWHRGETHITPSYMEISDGSTTMSLAPTDAGAIMRITNGKGPTKLRIRDAKVVGPFTIKLTTTRTSVFKAPPHTKLNVVITTDKPIASDFSFEHSELTLMIGTSFIDMNQAEANIPFSSFEEQRGVNDLTWNYWLGKVLIKDYNDNDNDNDNDGGVSKFYTLLHHSLLFPRAMSELHLGTTKHYSPYTKEFSTHPGQISTDSGFWDGFRTVYPFLHLVYPSLATRVLDGWVNSIKEDPSGLLPQWSSPGRVGSMEGSLGEVSIAEGIINDAVTDVDTAWNYLYKSCFIKGRENFDEYLMMGYVPGKVSLSLNYYLTDYVVSLAASKMGHHEIAIRLEERSRGWRLLFDQDTNFFRPKTGSGRFYSHFDQYEWMGAFRECGPWQERFHVPHDPVGLNGEDGYRGTMCKYLKDMMTGPNTISNRNKIHEMTEMQEHSFGQYSHNNQPSHHVLYMFANGGCAGEGQKWLNHALDTQYTDMGYAGDLDNGEQSSWYILSRLGLYTLLPGSGEYQLGVPPPWKEVILKERNIIIRNLNGKTTWETVRIEGETHYAHNTPKIKLDNNIKISY